MNNQYDTILLKTGFPGQEIDRRVKSVWNELFFGPDRIFFEAGETLGYMLDTSNDDVRTEGMSYGMMMAVQMDRKDVFDRL
jgi:oligosaccharide reducing-end xylanase